MGKEWKSVTVTIEPDPTQKKQRTLATFLNSNQIRLWHVIDSGTLHKDDCGIPFRTLMVFVIRAASLGTTKLSGF